jgi:hypothetical protein
MVRTVCSSVPLFWRGFAVWGWRGGGKSRLRGVEAELDGGLESGQSEAGEEVTNLLLAGVDDRPGGSVVDGGGHILTKSLEVAAKLIQEGIGGDGRFRGHGLLLFGEQTPRPASSAVLFSQRRRSRKICHTRRANVTASQ